VKSGKAFMSSQNSFFLPMYPYHHNAVQQFDQESSKDYVSHGYINMARWNQGFSDWLAKQGAEIVRQENSDAGTERFKFDLERDKLMFVLRYGKQ